MGSTSTHKEAVVPVRTFFEHYFTGATIIASGTRRDPDYVAGTVDWPYEFYAAVRYDEGHPHAGEVFAFVVLYAIAPSRYYNFTYKDLDETVGPVASHAPRAVLEALTPTTRARPSVACALLGEPRARGVEASCAPRRAHPLRRAVHVRRRAADHPGHRVRGDRA